MLKHCAYVKCGCGKQVEVAVHLNHDMMASFHSTSDPESQDLSQVGWPYYGTQDMCAKAWYKDQYVQGAWIP